MNRIRRLAAGLATVLPLAAAVGGLFLTRFFLAELGPQQYGLWLVGLQLLGCLSLLDLGVRTGRPGDTAPSALGEIVPLGLIQLPLVAAVAATAWWWLPPSFTPLRQAVGFALLLLVLLFPLRAFPAALEARPEDRPFLRGLRFLAWAVGAATAVAGVLAGEALGALAYGWTARLFVLCAGAGLRIHGRYPRFFRDPLELSSEALAARIRDSLQGGLRQVARGLVHGTDLLLVGYFLNPRVAVAYFATTRLPYLLMGLASVIPRSAPSQGPGPALLLTFIFSGTALCAALAVNGAFVERWLGGVHYLGLPVTVLWCLTALLRHGSHSLSRELEPLGFAKTRTLADLLDGVLTVAAGALLTWGFGPLGPVLGSLCGVLMVSLPLHVALLGAQPGQSPGGILRALLPWSWRFGLCVAVTGLVLRFSPPTSWGAVAGTACALAAASLLLQLTAARRGEMASYLQPYLQSLPEALRLRRGR